MKSLQTATVDVVEASRGSRELQDAAQIWADGGVAAGFAAVEPISGTIGPRAVTLYARLGWQPVGAPAPRRRTGKPEQRYELAF